MKQNVPSAFCAAALCLLCAAFLCGCATTARSIPKETADAMFMEGLSSSDGSGHGFLFLRLYNPAYWNPFYPAYLLELGIAVTEVHDGLMASHAGIGFDLNDTFYGMTQMSRPNLAVEHCKDVHGNIFMENCDPVDSTQTTYVLRVSEQEYRMAKQFLAQHREARYDNSVNAALAGKSILRKFFTAKEDRSISGFYGSDEDIEALNWLQLSSDTDGFVCSSFIGCLLYNSVESIHSFMNENGIDYHCLSVGDLTELPGVEKLFSSTWDKWYEAAGAFVSENEEFRPYLASAQGN